VGLKDKRTRMARTQKLDQKQSKKCQKKGETFTTTLHAEDKTPFLKSVTQVVMGTPIEVQERITHVLKLRSIEVQNF
jgi:phage terminase Nu1 subunit (DNA packaging protein)